MNNRSKLVYRSTKAQKLALRIADHILKNK